ncbi:G-protein coupled receptor 54-like, partial [Saccoglossus kowalevskii]|uniref:G-protein coupled receptor 54-like n=1 Tax=Saccoglossus kowalevskii TaxID=10224 RepID=A0ABM0MXR0_SACKO
VTVQATCSTLAIMTLDRYCVISKPLKARARRTKKAVVLAIAISWIASFLMHIPIAVYTEVMIDPYYLTPVCVSSLIFKPFLSKMYDVYSVLVMFVIPVTVIIASTASIVHMVCCMQLPSMLRKSRTTNQRITHKCGKQTTRRVVTIENEFPTEKKLHITAMVVIVAVLFIVCWCPVHAIALYYSFVTHESYNPVVSMNLSVVALCLSYINSCVNPVVYAFVGKKYRKYLLAIFPCRSKPPPRDYQMSTVAVGSRSSVKTL